VEKVDEKVVETTKVVKKEADEPNKLTKEPSEDDANDSQNKPDEEEGTSEEDDTDESSEDDGEKVPETPRTKEELFKIQQKKARVEKIR